MTAPVTAIILTLNESARVERCVRSLAWADRVVVVDSYSTDGTLDVITRTWRDLKRDPNDLIIVVRGWQGFTAARNASLEWARVDGWVFWVDADEWVTPELASEIRELVQSPPANPAHAFDVYRMPRQSYFLGRAIRHGGWYPDRKARLGRVGACVWRSGANDADVHEDLWPQGAPATGAATARGLLRGHLGHEPFLTRQEQDDTNRRYSSLLAEGLARKRRAEKSGPPSLALMIVKTGVKFLENYLVKLGVLDGLPGLYIALGSAKSLWMRLHKTRRFMLESA